ncbi:putative gustatory receptor 28b [Chelonus insularis]|uniref:putative gustatory receptor 28b n=1 Tax=Chelonus insularis TaxID=460826 RepID=UPI00158BEFEF|nr:putative gustatory receptor 28b [Chelonus insularis]
MQQYGMENDNGLVKKFQIFSLIVTIVLGPFSLVCHAVYYYYIRPEDLFASDLLLYHTIAQSLAMNFSFDLIVLVIYCKFKAVNKRINQINDQYTAALIVTEIRRVREVHHDICDVVRFVNNIHGVHLLLSSLNAFTMVVATLFRIYMGVVEGKNMFIMINNIIWLTYTAELAVTCFISTLACKESFETIIIMSRIVSRRISRCPRSYDFYSIGNPQAADATEISLRREISDFSLQLYHCDVTFSACEFFVINNKLLRSFIGVITTYLIILVQFYVPEGNNELKMNTTTESLEASIL